MPKNETASTADLAHAIDNLANALREARTITINVEFNDSNNAVEGLMRLSDRLPKALEQLAGAISKAADAAQQPPPPVPLHPQR